MFGYLETVSQNSVTENFRFPVQVNRPNADFRGFAGTVAAGSIAPGDAIHVLPVALRQWCEKWCCMTKASQPCQIRA